MRWVPDFVLKSQSSTKRGRKELDILYRGLLCANIEKVAKHRNFRAKCSWAITTFVRSNSISVANPEDVVTWPIEGIPGLEFQSTDLSSNKGQGPRKPRKRQFKAPASKTFRYSPDMRKMPVWVTMQTHQCHQLCNMPQPCLDPKDDCGRGGRYTI